MRTSVFTRLLGAALILCVGTTSFAQILDDPTLITEPVWLGPSDPREAVIIYDSTNGATGPGTAGLLFTTGSPNASFGDDINYSPPGAGLNRVISRVNVGFVVPANTAVPDSDMLVTFYNTENGAAMGTTVALSDPLGTARINIGSFTANANVRGFITGFEDVLAAGIVLPDAPAGDIGGVSVQFVAAGTNNLLPGVTITPGFSTGTVNPGSNFLTYFYSDGFSGSPFDGIYTGAERVGFGGANINNNKLWLQVEAVPEPTTLALVPVAAAFLMRRRRKA